MQTAVGQFTSMTLGRMMDAYIAHVARTGRPASLQNARAARRRLVEFFQARTDVREIVATGGLERYIDAKKRRGLSAHTINHALRYFRCAWQFVVDEKLDGAPPTLREVKRVRYMRTERKRPTALEPEELQAVLVAASHPRERAAMALAAYAGLRHQEILHLTIEDVDFSRRVIRVRGKAGWAPKSHEEREIPIGPSLEPYAVECLAGWTGRELPDPKSEEFWVFQGWKGSRLETIDVSAAFRAVGVEQWRRPGLHMLRRTFATLLHLRGTPIMVIKELLGHSAVEITESYIAVPEAAMVEACEGL